MLILKYTNIITFQLYLVILGVHVVILKIKSMFNSLKNIFSYLANQYKTCLEKVIKENNLNIQCFKYSMESVPYL